MMFYVQAPSPTPRSSFDPDINWRVFRQLGSNLHDVLRKTKGAREQPEPWGVRVRAGALVCESHRLFLDRISPGRGPQANRRRGYGSEERFGPGAHRYTIPADGGPSCER